MEFYYSLKREHWNNDGGCETARYKIKKHEKLLMLFLFSFQENKIIQMSELCG